MNVHVTFLQSERSDKMITKQVPDSPKPLAVLWSTNYPSPIKVCDLKTSTILSITEDKSNEERVGESFIHFIILHIDGE